MQIPILPLAVDWFELIIFLFIVGSSLIGKLMQANHQREARKRQRPIPPGQPQPMNQRGQLNQPRPGNQPPQQAPPQDRLEQEIEAFLRKSTPGEKTPPATPGQPRANPMRQAVKKKQRPAKRAALRPQPEQKAIRPSESVDQHVQRHIGSGGVAERDAHLGDQLELADERVEAHLHEVFDHRLGSLGSTTDQSISEGTDADIWDPKRAGLPVSAQLFDMLSSPQHVGTAIVLSEIIRRPSMDWDDDE